LELCAELDITDAIPETEQDDGKEYLLEQLHSAFAADSYVDKLYFEPQIKGRDILLLTGVGDVFPFMRIHILLEALQPRFPHIPILVMYPGDFDGSRTQLFNILKPNNYYRAFNLIDGGRK
jgi:hypothetical protein